VSGVRDRGGDACPVASEVFGIFNGDAVFGIAQAEGSEKRLGDEGEGGGSAKADAVLACEFEDLGWELADLVNFGEVAEFRGEFGERIGGIGQSVLFSVRGAELRRRV
jgi:hypothetical protein